MRLDWALGKNMDRLNRLKSRLKASEVARNTTSLTAGSGIRLALQAIYFILVARSLGPAQYGAFIGVVSLIAVLTPFSMLGMEGILARNVARQKESFPESWGNALLVLSIFGSVSLIAVTLLSALIFPGKVPLKLVLLIGSSDLILGSAVDLSSKAFQAFEMLGKTAQIVVILAGLRTICAVVMFAGVSHPDATTWGFLYLGSTAFCAAFAFMAVRRHLGHPRLDLSRLKTDIREGPYFSLVVSSQAIYNNIDKTMLLRLGTLDATGLYSTAYRVIDMVFLPVASVAGATYAKFFQHGSHGIRGAWGYAKRFLPFVASYGLASGFLLLGTAPLLPFVLGSQYAGADEALRWLSPLILLRTIHYFLSGSLTGADLQGIRSAIQIVVAAFNVGLNFWLIPAYSWRGAAWASLASDGLLLIAFWIAVGIMRTRSKSEEAVQGLRAELL